MMEVMMEKIVLSSVLSLSPSPTSELDVTSEGRSVQSDGLESDRSDGSNAGEIIHVFIEGVVVLVVLIVKFIAASAIQPRSNSAGSHVWWQSTFMEGITSICMSSYRPYLFFCFSSCPIVITWFLSPFQNMTGGLCDL